MFALPLKMVTTNAFMQMLQSKVTAPKQTRTQYKHNMKNYHIELKATGFKHTNKFSGFDSACAHFSTNEKPTTKPFVATMMEAIEKIGGQQVDHGWTGYAIGKLFIQIGTRKADIMSPEWDYHKGSEIPVWMEVASGDVVGDKGMEEEEHDLTSCGDDPTGPWATQDDYI